MRNDSPFTPEVFDEIKESVVRITGRWAGAENIEILPHEAREDLAYLLLLIVGLINPREAHISPEGVVVLIAGILQSVFNLGYVEGLAHHDD